MGWVAKVLARAISNSDQCCELSARYNYG